MNVVLAFLPAISAAAAAYLFLDGLLHAATLNLGRGFLCIIGGILCVAGFMFSALFAITAFGGVFLGITGFAGVVIGLLFRFVVLFQEVDRMER